MSGDTDNAQRLDKWLWYARALKSRTQAADLVLAGKVRINRERVEKPSQVVRPGDVLTAIIGGRVRVLKVLAPGDRRGPASEARLLYEDLSPPPAVSEPAPGARAAGAGRPTKRDRRAIDRLANDE